MKLQEPCPAGSNTGSLLSSLSQGVQGYIALVSTSVYPRSTLRQAAWGVRQGLGTTTRKKAACPGRGSHVPWWPLGPFFTVQLSYPYMTTGKTIALTQLGEHGMDAKS